MELPKLNFDNSFARRFKADPLVGGGPRRVLDHLYSLVPPTPVRDPQMLAWSPHAATLLGLDIQSPPSQGWEAKVFAGNHLLTGMNPISVRYGGHQFGQWASQLGDGRAISLGEVVGPEGRVEIQLKGAGVTPYSRRGDGRAVLRSSLREFICSEAMHFLGVPTTRALACVTTGESVVRDMLYDGNPKEEPGAITTRLAPSFLRFGNFEILARSGEIDLLRELVAYTIETHFPEIESEYGSPREFQSIARWFELVCERTAELMVHWLRVGFVHGVMNTDNLSVLGLTIDYGPYGWLDVYDPDWTPNTTDEATKRYRYSHQPHVALWNLCRLAEALSPLFEDPAHLDRGLSRYQSEFKRRYLEMISAKLGLTTLTESDAAEFVAELESMLQSTEVDPTIFYRKLADLQMREDVVSESGVIEALRDSFYSETLEKGAVQKILKWVGSYLARCAQESVSREQRKVRMNAVNPYFLPRNYLVQEALDRLEVGDRTRLDQLLVALITPYSENSATEIFFARRPEWARARVGCSALSCSS